MDESAAVPAGWYPDPAQGGRARWWDGSRWTDHLRSLEDVTVIHPRHASPATTQEQIASPFEPRRSRLHPVTLGAVSLLLIAGIGAAVWTVMPRDVADDAQMGTASGDPALTSKAQASDSRDDEPLTAPEELDEEGEELEDALPPSGSAEELRTPPPAPDRSLVLGYVLPETGMLAFIGPPMIAGIELAIEEVNGSGELGGFPVLLRRGDSAGDRDIARAEANRLLEVGVDAIVGAAATGMTLAIIDQVTGAGVVQCSPSNTSPLLSDYPDNGFYFRTAPSDALQGPVLAEQMRSDGHSTVAIAARGDDYGQALLDSTTAAFEAQGGSVVLGTTYDPNADRFDAVVNDLLHARADAYLVISFAEGADIVQGLLAAGTATDSMYGADGIAGAAFADEVDPSNPSVLDGMTFTAPTSRRTPEFESALFDFRPGLVDLLFAPQAYDCTNLIALSAAVAGSVDATAIRAHMIDVTVGDNACGSFPECMEFVQVGESIAYQSAAGDALAFTEVREGSGEPSRGTYEVSRFVEGEFTLIDTVVGVVER